MTRKDYILIARVLSECRRQTPAPAYNAIVEAFAHELSAEDPRFNMGKFLKACYTNNTLTKELQT